MNDIFLSDCYVRVLDISGFNERRLGDFCRSIKIDALPATLEKLVCKGCVNLTEIDIALPDALRHLELANCDSLESWRFYTLHTRVLQKFRGVRNYGRIVSFPKGGTCRKIQKT
jgi:hypothetical protein